MRKIGKRREFIGQLMSKGPGGAWMFLPIPFSVEKEFGKKTRVPVSDLRPWLPGSPKRSRC